MTAGRFSVVETATQLRPLYSVIDTCHRTSKTVCGGIDSADMAWAIVEGWNDLAADGALPPAFDLPYAPTTGDPF